MPAFDVLNPSPLDPLNPDYGWTKKRPTTNLAMKARSGPAYSREITDAMHSFVLNWGSTIDSQKMWVDIARLKRYYEQYRDGYFTLIDWEGNGRNYVGRFTSPVEVLPVGHNRWAAQNVLFEEVPLATMLNYPSDWDNEAIFQYCLDDFGQIRPAVDNWANWTLTSTTSDPVAVGPSSPATGGSFDLPCLPYGSYTLPAQPGTAFNVNPLLILPSAAIVGIEVSFQRQTFPLASNVVTEAVQLLKAGVAAGSPKSSSTEWTKDWVTETYGGPADLWGTTWAASDILNVGFGFSVAPAYDIGGGPIIRAQGQTYQITVYYSTTIPELQSSVTNAWAQLGYVGWGVQIWMTSGPDHGIAAISLDGVAQGTIDGYSASNEPPAMLMQLQNVPLGQHILQVQVTGTKNASSSGYKCVFDYVQVMR